MAPSLFVFGLFSAATGLTDSSRGSAQSFLHGQQRHLSLGLREVALKLLRLQRFDGKRWLMEHAGFSPFYTV